MHQLPHSKPGPQKILHVLPRNTSSSTQDIRKQVRTTPSSTKREIRRTTPTGRQRAHRSMAGRSTNELHQHPTTKDHEADIQRRSIIHDKDPSKAEGTQHRNMAQDYGPGRVWSRSCMHVNRSTQLVQGPRPTRVKGPRTMGSSTELSPMDRRPHQRHG